MKFKVLGFIILGIIMLQAGSNFQHIEREIRQGNFERAEKKIVKMLESHRLSKEDRLYLNDTKLILNRIRLDFNKNEDDMIQYLRNYYPELNNSMLREWEQSNALEMKIIDGRKKYFSQAHHNLFRIDSLAKAHKLDIDGRKIDGLDEFLKPYLPKTIKKIDKSSDNFGPLTKMKLHYTVSLDADVVPAGEVVSAWLPWPREDNARQVSVVLLKSSESDYIISPESYAHHSIFMQKKAEKGKKTEFNLSFIIETRAQWFDLKRKNIKPYDKSSAIYKKFTAEGPHIQFSDKIKELSKEIVGNEKNPLLISRKLFSYISENYPWASAREYSTIENIPEYCMEHQKGDCGQVTLLFMALARYNGIPAKWQSGWMLHPGEVNLHDWSEIFFEGIGWVPVDQSYGLRDSEDPDVKYFYSNGIDAYRLIVNDGYSQPFFPAKIYLRSETVDFQRGELEWRGGNLYFNSWDWDMDVEYLK